MGDANTNINLRNAFCDGTWNKPKPGPYVPDFEGIAPIPSDKPTSPETITPDQSKIVPRGK